SRIDLICLAVNDWTAVRQATSKMPHRLFIDGAGIVQGRHGFVDGGHRIAAILPWSFRFHLNKVSFRDQFLKLTFRQGENVLGCRFEFLRFISPDVVRLALAKPYINTARSPRRKTMIVRYPHSSVK